MFYSGMQRHRDEIPMRKLLMKTTVGVLPISVNLKYLLLRRTVPMRGLSGRDPQGRG